MTAATKEEGMEGWEFSVDEIDGKRAKRFARDARPEIWMIGQRRLEGGTSAPPTTAMLPTDGVAHRADENMEYVCWPIGFPTLDKAERAGALIATALREGGTLAYALQQIGDVVAEREPDPDACVHPLSALREERFTRRAPGILTCALCMTEIEEVEAA